VQLCESCVKLGKLHDAHAVPPAVFLSLPKYKYISKYAKNLLCSKSVKLNTWNILELCNFVCPSFFPHPCNDTVIYHYMFWSWDTQFLICTGYHHH
jgi:hypothetical protein